MANIVAIVGRPNVGKSTLFNRLVEAKKAITNDFSGVTRDRHYGQSEWNGKHFTVIDTGGYVVGSDDLFEESIRNQVELALDEATVILFVVDGQDGISPLDEEFSKVLRRTKKPVYLVVNKADNSGVEQSSVEFYSLGIGSAVYPLSSMTGSGTGELLDEVVNEFKEDDTEDPYEGLPRIAVLGRPNVGKSSFLNALIGTERSIVTNEAGTTRDSVNTLYNAYGKKFVLTDTAGLRKKTKVREDIEFYSVLRSIKALEDSDVCIIMLDASRGIEGQDLNIITLAHRRKKGIILMVNKWDLIDKDHMTSKKFEDEIKRKLMPIGYMPIIFTSVLNKQRIFKAIEKAIEVNDNKNLKIPTSQLNELLLSDIEKYPPPAIKGKYIRIKYITQLPTPSPTFAFFCNLPQYIKEPYERYLMNKIRDHFGFEGIPIKVVFRKK